MPVKPYGPWVLITPDPPETQYKGIIYLPDGNTEQRLSYASGVVQAVGHGDFNTKKHAKTKFVPHDVLPGQRVVFRGHLQVANTVDGTKDCLIHIRDIIGELVEGQLNMMNVHS